MTRSESHGKSWLPTTWPWRQRGESYLVVRPGKAVSGSTLAVVLEHSESGPRSLTARIDLTGPSARSISTADTEIEIAGPIPGLYQLVAHAFPYRSEPVTVELEVNEVTRVLVRLEPVAPPLEELTVGASRYEIMRDLQHSNAYFSRAQVEHLSDLGDDPVRAVHRLPGTAAGGVSDFSSGSAAGSR